MNHARLNHCSAFLHRFLMSAGFALAAICLHHNAHADLGNVNFHVSVGYAKNSYPSDIQNVINQLNALGATHSAAAVDLGLYGPSTLDGVEFGGCIAGAIDTFEFSFQNLDLNRIGIYFSTLKFFGESMGDGAFARLDVGFPHMSATTTTSVTLNSKTGMGFQAGGGYNFDMGRWHLMTSALFSLSRIESNNYGTFSINVGAFF
jgi:hypothetical protein